MTLRASIHSLVGNRTIVFVILLLSNSLAIAINEKTPQEIAKIASAAFVTLTTFDKHGNPLALGSGFFIRSNLLVTNFHVVKGSSTVLVYCESSKKTYKPRSILTFSQEFDLAILQTDESHATTLPLGDSDAVEIGEKAYALGNPEGLEQTFSEGIISSKRNQGAMKLLQTTTPISSGSSGGPLLDSRANVVGVITATLNAGQNLNFAVPSTYIKQLVEGRSKQPKKLLTNDNSSSAVAASTPNQLTPDVRLVDHWFFVGSKQKDGQFTNYRGRASVVKNGQIFGCKILYSTRKSSVHLRGILKGPAALKQFNAEGFQMKFSSDGTQITADREVDSKSPMTGIFWGIGPNDPRGSYELECLLEGRTVEKQAFVVPVEQRSVANQGTLPPGYGKARWGMSFAQVMGLFPGGGRIPSQNGEVDYGVVRPVGIFPTGFLLFHFKANKLNRVIVLFPDQGSSVNLKTGDYVRPSPAGSKQIQSSLFSLLSKKYGAPDPLSKEGATFWLPPNGDMIVLTTMEDNTVGISYDKVSNGQEQLEGL
jgi:hypothetical protein